MIKNRQREDCHKLMKVTIPQVIQSYNFETDNVEAEFSLFPVSDSSIVEVNNSLITTLKTQCKLHNKVTNEKVEFNVSLLNLPVYDELGFKLKGNYIQVLDLYDRMPGWTFTTETKEPILSCGAFNAHAKLLAVGKASITFSVHDSGAMYIQLKDGSTKMLVSAFFKAITNYTDADLLEIFGYDNPYIVSAFTGRNSVVNPKQNAFNSVKKFDPCVTRNACIDVLAKLLVNPEVYSRLKSVAEKSRKVQQYLFDKRYLNFGEGQAQSLMHTSSFRNRALHKELAEDIRINDEVIKAGTILTEELLQLIDMSLIDSLKVRYNNKIYTLRKFSFFQFRGLGCTLAKETFISESEAIPAGTKLTMDVLDKLNSSNLTSIEIREQAAPITRRLDGSSLTIEDLFTVFSIFADNVNGFDLAENPYDLTKRIVVPYAKVAENVVSANMSKLVTSIRKSVEFISDNETLLDCISNFNKDINLDELLNKIAPTESVTGQAAELANILAFDSKSYKVTTDIKDNNMVSDALTSVQGLQFGRLDAIDAPESSKIGLVHFRTMLAKENKYGKLTAPFLRVKNGEILSEEPVYLTADEQADKYTAEWCETFYEDEAKTIKKKRITVSYNGNITTVPIEQVTLMEYSQLQNYSPARAMIPFGNHDAPKRQLMAGNHTKQAQVQVKSERAFVNTGIESINNIGVYRASDVLERYFSDVNAIYDLAGWKDEILNSRLHLVTITDANDKRDIIYEVEFVTQQKEANNVAFASVENIASLTIPYMQKNSESGLFTYKVRATDDGYYQGSDIVAHDASFDLNNYDMQLYADYGHMKIDDSVFEHGIGFGRNMFVGFKTFEGTTIDDACTVNARMVYDGLLDTITMKKITVECKHSESKEELFCKHLDESETDQLSYIGADGFPEIGTILKPGDAVVCKKVIMRGEDGTKVKSSIKYLSKYQSGQVVRVQRYKTEDNTDCVDVILASRSSIEVGDKMSGRHGNKGVVAQVVPESQMPYNPKNGKALDMILNPLGVPSRMNIGQLLDTLAGYCAQQEGKHYVVSPYYKNAGQLFQDKANELGIHPEYLCDGRTGQMLERPVNVGYQYMYVLTHKVQKKIHAIGVDSQVDPVFLQPRKGQKNDGGQAFGEMELWCLAGIGANKVLQEIYSDMSDNISAKKDIKASLSNAGALNQTVDLEGDNKNDYAVQAMARSFCVEITNTSEGEFAFRPLTDREIRGFAAKPIADKAGLHSSALFGAVQGTDAIERARSHWGYIDLKIEIVHPIFIAKGKIHEFIVVHHVKESKSKFEIINGEKKPCLETHCDFMSTNRIYDLLEGRSYASYRDNEWYFYDTDKIAERSGATNLQTGMKAFIEMLKTADVRKALVACDDKLEKKRDLRSPDAVKLLKRKHRLVEFIRDQRSLTDFIISSFPVMPQTFRPEIKSSGRQQIPDFDHHYIQILNAVANNEKVKTDKGAYEIYKAIFRFAGLGDCSSNKGSAKYQNISSWFFGKGKKGHGKFREALLSKRLFRSGRSVITPTSTTSMSPMHVGLPIHVLVDMYEIELIAYISKQFGLSKSSSACTNREWKKILTAVAARNFYKFKQLHKKHLAQSTRISADECYTQIIKHIKTYIEGAKDVSGKWIQEPQVVLLGRQPSLHKYSIRAYYIKVVFTKTIQINTMVCHGYNADFDGDTMWFLALMSKEAKLEAINLMSPAKDFINPKDSKSILELTQDVVLGVYNATMLKDNAISFAVNPELRSDIRFYNSIAAIKTDLEADMLKAYNVVCYRKGDACYLSTAGRILFNSLIPKGFTRQPYENHLGILNPSNPNYKNAIKGLYELRYEGLVAGKGGVSHDVKYCSLSKICEDLFTEIGEAAVDVYQEILEFGFYFADKFSCTLSMEDLQWDTSDEAFNKKLAEFNKLADDEFAKGYYTEQEHARIIKDNKKKIKGQMKNTKAKLISSADAKREALERDYQEGLVSDDGRRKALERLYSNANKNIKDYLAQSMPRNNNLFIMFDSGARGNAGQIMQTCGSVGILQKTKTENLETSVTRSYTEGLSSFDIQMASYSARTGVASTQNETKDAGHGTRTAVYMACGLHVKEFDCGKEDWWFDVLWGARKDKIVLKPTKEWFNNNLLGRKVGELDVEMNARLIKTLNNGVITEESYNEFAKGFSSIVLEKEDGKIETLEISMNTLNWAVLLEEDDKIFRNFLKTNRLNPDCIRLIEKHHIHRLKTSYGEFIFSYELDPAMPSLLIGRVARNLPFLKKVSKTTPDWGYHSKEVITKETINYIEQEGIERIEARVFLDCETKDGICACCYGLKYSNQEFPYKDEDVGYASAQSIGEPSAQLTMSLFHSGGAAGASVANGITVCSSLYDGTVPDLKRCGTDSMIAQIPGFIHIKKIDNKSSIYVVQEHKDCALCRRCKASYYGKGELPLGFENDPCLLERDLQGLCLASPSEGSTENTRIVVREGDYVNVGDNLTSGYNLANNIPTSSNYVEQKYLVRKKQMTWLMNYYNTFLDNNISLNARHFEVLAYLQNCMGFVIDSADDNFEVGKSYAVTELMKADNFVDFEMRTWSKQQLVTELSGPLTALSFERVPEIIASLAANNVVCKNNSVIGGVLSGINLKTGKPRIFQKPQYIARRNIKQSKEDTTKVQQFEDILVDVELENSAFDAIDDALFDDIFADTKPVAEAKDATISTGTSTEMLNVFDKAEPETKISSDESNVLKTTEEEKEEESVSTESIDLNIDTDIIEEEEEESKENTINVQSSEVKTEKMSLF